MKRKKTGTDGGYYAIKGFTYQFDKSLLAALANPVSSIEIEQIQDIGIDGYYIQVKYKEAQTYAPSKVRPAVMQLLDLSIADKSKKFCLYCYFKDRAPQRSKPTVAELDLILGTKKAAYTAAQKKDFVARFDLEFSDDFQKQFISVIANIKTQLGLRTDEEATLYHALFRAHLLEVAVKKSVKARTIDFQALRGIVKNSETLVFELAYWKHLTAARYYAYLKKEYFTFKKVNVPQHERLFIIEVEAGASDADITKAVTNIQQRYYKKDVSPAPYICFDRLLTAKLTELKRKLWDQKLEFADGTHFNGDGFRPKDLAAPVLASHHKATFKLVSSEDVPALLKEVSFDDVYVFTISADGWWRGVFAEFKEFYLQNTKDIIKVIA